MSRLKRDLGRLVQDRTILSYKIEIVDMDGNIVEEEIGSRNSERLTLRFSNNRELVINTFCSGCLENTCFC